MHWYWWTLIGIGSVVVFGVIILALIKWFFGDALKNL